MLLRHSATSPFVRKVAVLLHETGLIARVSLATVDGWAEPDELTADNPLSMVPTLVLDDGSTLYDSPVICDYLDRQHDGPTMIPTDGAARWQVLRDQALADGILDCAVLVFVELGKRPEDKRWDWWLDVKRRAITRALDLLEREVGRYGGRIDLGTISVAVALGYLDLRGAVGDWRDARPQLAAWYARFAARPSMVATAPPA
ncbi:MAG: glutathione S-transferase N-terminal domain-containing protein [Gammaproteobacteria bacterium]|nr:glutathione S-transferase N-terminal domain-containing protein [Gammaproteobacteria bacterium]